MSGLPDRFPRGWFVLGHQRDFPIGEEKIIYGFNQKILVERTEEDVKVDVGSGAVWPVLEINQMLMVWHDHENKEPDFYPEKIDACYSDEWSDYGMASFLVKNNCRELIDNMADKGHFGPVHQAPFEGFWNEAKDHTYTQEMTADSPILGRDLSRTVADAQCDPVAERVVWSTKESLFIWHSLWVPGRRGRSRTGFAGESESCKRRRKMGG